ncbi:MAG: hypothetical protein LT105_15455 [Lentimicrobium sp.]|nr:hypothetical protein [Lentimicrobium sp.]
MKKIIVFVTAINFLAITLLFVFEPKRSNAANEKIWDAEWVNCLTNPPTQVNSCSSGNTWVTCVTAPCGQMISGIEIIKKN